MTTLKSIVVSAIVAYASAFQPPSLHSGFIGNAVQQRVTTAPCLLPPTSTCCFAMMQPVQQTRELTWCGVRYCRLRARAARGA
eukprot:3933438-Rhodomonas_salina.1